MELGVTNFVLSPGSRNAPLSIALNQAAEAGLIELHVRIDERGAAFFALGISKASNNYVAVICTSGTAAANFHPAALEALHNRNKLLLITADRPASLRKSGANQTTEQFGLFPNIESHDIATAIDLAPLLGAGPIHLNIQFEEPLLPVDQLDWLAGFSMRAVAATQPNQPTIKLPEAGVLIVGHDRAGYSVAEISQFADQLGWPLIAEDPISFPAAIAHAAIFLADENTRALLTPTTVVVIGRTTLSRSINTYVQSATEIIAIDPRMADLDTSRQADRTLYSLPALSKHAPEPTQWLALWQDIAKRCSHEITSNLEWSEQSAIRAIVSELPDECALFVGSSRPIRDIEGFAAPRSGIAVYANRGLAGIDGNISTAMGVATRYQNTFAVMGDLTFLHDVSALVNLPHINLTIFVIDNNGGGIFSTLPQHGAAGFERIFGTPHNNDIARIARGFGLPAECVKTASDLKAIIAHQSHGIEVVVVEVPDRESNAARLKEISQMVSSALRIGNNLDWLSANS
jgi:2-succinyl-5-enolpyruvyl-6-hydroxy-3-cyclohexene-1-carboxylate synthase